MKLRYIAHTILDLDFHPGNKQSKHDGCSILLDVVPPLKAAAYMEPNGMLTCDGSKIMTNVLTQGLIANIHLAHQEGWRDSAEHLRYVIAELEKGFVAVADVVKRRSLNP